MEAAEENYCCSFEGVRNLVSLLIQADQAAGTDGVDTDNLSSLRRRRWHPELWLLASDKTCSLLPSLRKRAMHSPLFL